MFKEKISYLFKATGKKQIDLAEKKGISKQQLSNKLRAGAYKGKDLLEIADFTETKLAFIDKNGKVVVEFDSSDIE